MKKGGNSSGIYHHVVNKKNIRSIAATTPLKKMVDSNTTEVEPRWGTYLAGLDMLKQELTAFLQQMPSPAIQNILNDANELSEWFHREDEANTHKSLSVYVEKYDKLYLSLGEKLGELRTRFRDAQVEINARQGSTSTKKRPRR